ncbi:RluA family pseudouridine synthase [Olleya sp. R77988]|uniref:RluA family pseudouridine synthase n=1 Tax=Olleya sp. R77988 TaxID=3093875 RepID=UPI0037CA80F1
MFTAAFTKSALKKALKKQFITVNDVVATSATYIYGGEHIQLTIKENTTPKRTLIFKLKVLFEDDYLAVIHKPAGILVSGNCFKTVAAALIQNLQKSTLSDRCTPQPIHRLDYATTGILLVGKTSSSIRALNQVFKDRAITKTYYAVTIGNMETNGNITTMIDGKPSHSKYTLCQSVASKRFGTLNLVQLNPLTGRRHQLRKHLSSIGNPILGDKDYGVEPLILNGKGMYLHAFSLQFTHPFTKEALYIIDDLPKRFKKMFKSC